MKISVQEKLTSRILAFSLSGVTILVFTKGVTDPVNVTKLFLLGGLAFASIGSVISSEGMRRLLPHKIPLSFLALFTLSSVISLGTSKAPISQSLYGVYGRNNGFLLYLLLILLFIATLSLRHENSFKKLLGALFIAGSINVAYALWVLIFGDFVGWNNIYGNLLGTLGNPNFIGSFFGMFSALLLTYFFDPKSSWRIKLSIFILVCVTFIGIIETHAVQGKVLFITSFCVVMFFFVRTQLKYLWLEIMYVIFVSIGFLFALLGTLQKGPLTPIMYKETVSLRGEYWYAGWVTGMQHPWFGVGFDSYGDWYRRSRRESALTLPGVDTVTNTAHNVYLDIFSFGGWPLFISYLALNIYVLFCIFKVTLRDRTYNPIFISLVGVWICYQLQSLVSINQIGLAIWGWVIGAAIIAFSHCQFEKLYIPDGNQKQSSVKNQQTQQIISPQLIAGLLSIVGFIICVPPLSADSKWREAQLSQDVAKVESVLQRKYLNPPNTFKYVNVVGVFETNGLFELAHKYALEAVAYNPDSFESWRNLSQLKFSTPEQRKVAFDNMKRLDPFNPKLGNAK